MRDSDPLSRLGGVKGVSLSLAADAGLVCNVCNGDLGRRTTPQAGLRTERATPLPARSSCEPRSLRAPSGVGGNCQVWSPATLPGGTQSLQHWRARAPLKRPTVRGRVANPLRVPHQRVPTLHPPAHSLGLPYGEACQAVCFHTLPRTCLWVTGVEGCLVASVAASGGAQSGLGDAEAELAAMRKAVLMVLRAYRAHIGSLRTQLLLERDR